MIPYIILFVSLFLLFAVITYAWWVLFRVWVLRQDLFEIRDRLFDEAVAKGFTNDPSYRACRESLHGLIRLAPRISLPLWRFAASRAGDCRREKAPIDEVEKALVAAGLRIHSYVFRQTLSGVVYATFASLFNRTKYQRRDRQETCRIIRSDEMVRLDREYMQYEPPQSVNDLVGV